MQVHYLEIVTEDVEAACDLHAKVGGVTFGEATPGLGGARTAKLKDGGMMGIRAPMHDAEKPTTRPYVLVDDIEAAVAAASKAGAQIAVPPMKLPGFGTCAVYFHGGIEAGFWQLGD
ncbi:MAG: hydroxylase [Planctomycetota bacterium]